MRWIVLLSLCLAACQHQTPIPIPPPVETFEQMVQRTEYFSCAYDLLHVDGDNPDCRLAYSAWNRAKDAYRPINPKVDDEKMGAVTFYRPALSTTAGQTPRFCCGQQDPPQPVQGLFFQPNAIHFAHERVIYCEALHYLAYILGDPAWAVIGHNDPADPLHFECWKIVEQEWQEAHSS